MPLLLISQVVAFFAVTAAVFAAYLRLEGVLQRRALRRRISGGETAEPTAPRLGKGTRDLLIRLGRSAAPKEAPRLEKLERELGYAGYRTRAAVFVFLGLKLALALAAGGLFVLLLILGGSAAPRSLVLAFFPLAAGYYLPGLLLRRQVAARRRRISKELPDALDLMLICMEAGLSFDMALYRVSRELPDIAPVLSHEFSQYFLEIKGGLPRRQVLDNLARRNGERSLTNVVQVLIQSARFGTDIAEAMRVYAESLRSERKLKAEEKGAKIATKLTFPTILLILPALMLIILGPAAINLVERLR
jgi:tight adherence protein C